MNNISFPAQINWTYQPQTNHFLFLCEFGKALKEEISTDEKFINWFEQATGIHRLNIEEGSFFQVIGANDPADFQQHILTLSRGIILQSDPLTVAGTTAFEPSENIESITSADRKKLVEALSQFDNKAAENVTHALKAPVNRIKGIAQILKAEFTESPEQALLIKYLSQTSEKLSVIVDHLLRDGDNFTQKVTVDSVVDSALNVAKRINNRPIETRINQPDFELDPQYATVLERVIIELLSFNQPLFANERSIDLSMLEASGLIVRINHHFPSGKIELEKGKLIEEKFIPGGVNELIRKWNKSTFITGIELDAWTYSLFLPL